MRTLGYFNYQNVLKKKENTAEHLIKDIIHDRQVREYHRGDMIQLYYKISSYNNKTHLRINWLFFIILFSNHMQHYHTMSCIRPCEANSKHNSSFAEAYDFF